MMRRITVGLLLVAVLVAALFAIDRTIVAWRNESVVLWNEAVVLKEHGFARWPTTRLGNPLVGERLDSWDRLGIDCPPGFCTQDTHAWARYIESGGEVFVSFFDYARLLPASIHLKRGVDGKWQECRSGSWTECGSPMNTPPHEKYVREVVQNGHRLLARERVRNSTPED